MNIYDFIIYLDVINILVDYLVMNNNNVIVFIILFIFVIFVIMIVYLLRLEEVERYF